MFQHAPYRFLLGIAGAFVLGLLPQTVQAQVTATPSVTLIGSGLYRYDYTIANNTPDDLITVSIFTLPGINNVFNVTAPAGFTPAYDYNTGRVDFIEGTTFYATNDPVGISGFTYDSGIAPQTSAFEASRFDLVNGNFIVTTNATIAAVPEPGSIALLGAGGMAACFAMRKRRNRAKFV